MLSRGLLVTIMMSCELILGCLLFNDGKSVMSLLGQTYISLLMLIT